MIESLQTLGVGIVVIVAIVWVSAATLTVAVLWSERYSSEVDSSCPIPSESSNYGSSTWSWWPPGKVCHYPDGSEARPGAIRVVVIGLLGATAVAGALGYAIVEYRTRDTTWWPMHGYPR